MGTLTIVQDIWTPATEQQKASALAALASLPSRPTTSDLDKASYYLALDGVTRYGLTEAVKVILRNALGHAFFPSPPELRGQCDKAMEWHQQQRERQRRQEQYLLDRQANNAITQRSPSAIARQQAAYAKFCEGYKTEQNKTDEAERAEIRARYGLTDEALAAIPDQPDTSTFKKVGQS